MKFETYITPKGNTFKLITRTDNVQIGYQVFMHNENPPTLTTENIEMRNLNYIGIHLCAAALPHITEGIDIPKELSKHFPATDWMQVDPMYALCTIGTTTDIRLLKNKGEHGKERMGELLRSLYKFLFIDICAKSMYSLAEKADIQKDIRKSIFKLVGLEKTKVKKPTDWDKEAKKLWMGGIDGKEKKV